MNALSTWAAPRLHASDGRSALRLSSAALVFVGVAVVFLGISGRFLPHDERFLGMTAADLCSLHGCRIVHFMIHDRISFGGALITVGILYWWLTDGPIHLGQAWGWWTLVLSSLVGFASFLTYLGYGYLDTWHGLATLALLPCFVLGLLLSRLHYFERAATVRERVSPWPTSWRERIGRLCLLGTALGLTFGGLTIMLVGTTCVFVPQDLEFLDLRVEEMHTLNPRLIPLIAHDRAGFGGAVCCVGVALCGTIWSAPMSCNLWWTLALVGVIGFGAGIAVHPAIGYIDTIHLAPAVVGAIAWSAGLALTSGGRTRDSA